jgi:hypothetical protein
VSQPERILFEIKTDFEQYQVVDRVYEGRPARVLFSGTQRSAQSGIGLDDDPDLLFDYNQRLLEIANALYPSRILVIGGGAFTLPTAFVTALPDATVDVVELDPGLPKVAERFFGLRQSSRLRVITGDGRAFLERTNDQYDLIILDVFQNLSVPQQFLTTEFVQVVHSHLTDTGALAMNIIASYQGRNTGLIKSQIAGYGGMFPQVTIFPAAHGLTSWLPQNMVLVAEKKPLADLATYVRYAPFTLLQTDETDRITDA